MPITLLSNDYISLGREIRRQRIRLGLTQQELAKMIPCSLSYISHIENGDKPSLDMLVRLAHILGLSLDMLL